MSERTLIETIKSIIISECDSIVQSDEQLTMMLMDVVRSQAAICYGYRQPSASATLPTIFEGLIDLYRWSQME